MSIRDDLNTFISRSARTLSRKHMILRRIDLEKIEQRFPGITVSGYFGGYGPVLQLPLTFSLIEEVRQFMGREFPQYEKYRDSRTVNSGYAYHNLAYKMDTSDLGMIAIEFNFNSYTEGATCVMNKIGIRMVEEAIYEVICPEGAEEFHV